VSANLSPPEMFAPRSNVPTRSANGCCHEALLRGGRGLTVIEADHHVEAR
jgi:hypothetical protein